MDPRRSRLAIAQQRRSSPIPRIDFIPLVRDAVAATAPASPLEDERASAIRISSSGPQLASSPASKLPRGVVFTPNINNSTSSTTHAFPPAPTGGVVGAGAAPLPMMSSVRRASPRAAAGMEEDRQQTHPNCATTTGSVTRMTPAPQPMGALITTATIHSPPSILVPLTGVAPPESSRQAATTRSISVTLCSAATAPTSPWTMRFVDDDMERCFREHYYNFRRVSSGVLVFLGLVGLGGVSTAYRFWHLFNFMVQLAAAATFLGGAAVFLLTRRARHQPISLPARFVGANAIATDAAPAFMDGRLMVEADRGRNLTAIQNSDGVACGGSPTRSRRGSVDDDPSAGSALAWRWPDMDLTVKINIREGMLLLCHCMAVLAGIGNVTYPCENDDDACRSSSLSIESEGTLFAIMLVAVSFAPARCFLMIPVYLVGTVVLILLYYVPGDHSAVPYRSTDAVMIPFVILVGAETLNCLGVAVARECRRRQAYRHHVERQRRRLEAQRLHEHLRQVTAAHLPLEFLVSEPETAQEDEGEGPSSQSSRVRAGASELRADSGVHPVSFTTAVTREVPSAASVNRLWTSHKSDRGVAIVVGLARFNEWATQRGPADVVSLMRFVHHHIDICVDSVLSSTACSSSKGPHNISGTGRRSVARCLKTQAFGDEVRLMVLPNSKGGSPRRRSSLGGGSTSLQVGSSRSVPNDGGGANPLDLPTVVGSRAADAALTNREDGDGTGNCPNRFSSPSRSSTLSPAFAPVRRAGVALAAAILQNLATHLDSAIAGMMHWTAVTEEPLLRFEGSAQVPLSSSSSVVEAERFSMVPFVVAAEGTCRYRWNPVTNSVIEFGPAMTMAVSVARKRMLRSTRLDLCHPPCDRPPPGNGLSSTATASPPLGCLILRVENPAEVLRELGIAERAVLDAPRYLSVGIGAGCGGAQGDTIALRVYTMAGERGGEIPQGPSEVEGALTVGGTSPSEVPQDARFKDGEPVAFWLGVLAASSRVHSREYLFASTSSGAISADSRLRSHVLADLSPSGSASGRDGAHTEFSVVTRQQSSDAGSPTLRQHLEADLRKRDPRKEPQFQALDDAMEVEVRREEDGEDEYEDPLYDVEHRGQEPAQGKRVNNASKSQWTAVGPNDVNETAREAADENEETESSTTSLARRGSCGGGLDDAFSRSEERVALKLAYGIVPYFPYRPLEDEYQLLVTSYATTMSHYDIVLSSVVSIVSCAALLAANHFAGTPGFVNESGAAAAGNHPSSTPLRPALSCVCGMTSALLTMAIQLVLLPHCGGLRKTIAAYCVITGVYVTHVWYLLAVVLSPQGTIVGNTQALFVYIAASWSLSRPMMGFPISVLVSWDAFVGALLLLRTSLYLKDTRSTVLYPTCMYIPGVSAMWLFREYSRRDSFAMEKLVELLRQEIEFDYQRLEKALDVMVPAGVAGTLVQRVRRQHLEGSRQNFGDKAAGSLFLFSSSARSQRNAAALVSRNADPRDFIGTAANTSSVLSTAANNNINNNSALYPSLVMLHPLRSGSGNLQTKDVPFFLILRDRQSVSRSCGGSGRTTAMMYRCGTQGDRRCVPHPAQPLESHTGPATTYFSSPVLPTVDGAGNNNNNIRGPADGRSDGSPAGLRASGAYASFQSTSTARSSSHFIGEGGVTTAADGEPWQAVVCRVLDKGQSGIGGGVHAVQCTERCLLVVCAANASKELATVSARCARLLAALESIRRTCFRVRRDADAGSKGTRDMSASSSPERQQHAEATLDPHDFRILADVGPLMGATAGLSRMVFGFFGGRLVSALSALESLDGGLFALNVDLLDYVAERLPDISASDQSTVRQELLNRRWCHRDDGIPKRYYTVEPLPL